MWTDNDFIDYELLDAARGERLERWGDYTLVRPDPQVIWRSPRLHKGWRNADAVYTRSPGGGGSWSKNTLPAEWTVTWRDIAFRVKPTGFKHTGLFPEQAANWAVLDGIIRKAEKPLNILNLFAYTGAATVVCAKAGAKVTHVDAAKGMVSWARENAAQNGVEARWIVDDCGEFIGRELRRGNLYDGILLDPPSYGRGSGGQIWKLEDDLYDFLLKAANLLSPGASFFFLNTYTTGLAPRVLKTLLDLTVTPRFGGYSEAGELGLCAAANDIILPCGATGRWLS